MNHQFFSEDMASPTTCLSRLQRVQRDIKLLLEMYQSDQHPRTAFYLGQSYQVLKDWFEAIKWYQKCVESSDYSEQVYYSLYSIGVCLHTLFD